MSVTHQLQALTASFSPAEKRVADYVVKHAERIPFRSVHAIARAVGVNAASVCRMVRRAGFADFQELKIALARETANSISAIHQAVQPGDNDREITQKVFGSNIKSLEATLNTLKFSDLSRAAKAIAQAAGVVFFGVGSSGCVAQDAALRLKHLRIRAEACVDSYQMMVHATQMTREHVAVGISHSGRTTVTVQALRCARDAGGTTIGIANYLRSPLQRASSIFFRTAFHDTSFEATALSAGVAQICLVDALYLLVARHHPAGMKVDRLNRTVEELCRIPEGKE